MKARKWHTGDVRSKVDKHRRHRPIDETTPLIPSSVPQLQRMVDLGLGRIVALHRRSSTSYQIH